VPQPDPDLQTGLHYLRAGQFDRAEPLFRSALGRHGERPDILHFLAVCLSQRGALGDAEAMWRKALAKDPHEPMLSYNLGLVARRQGRLDEAARRFRDTLRRQPAHIEARLALASVQMDLGRYAAGERELAELVGKLDEAIQQGGDGLKPLQSRARNMLGYALYRLGKLSEAIEVLDMALVDAAEDAARRSQILGDRALAVGALGYHDEAIAEAGQAIELAPQSAVLHHVLGFVLHFAGRSSEAIAPIRRSLEIDPSFAVALKTLALAQAAIGKDEEAVHILQQALRHNPLDRDAVLQLSNLHVERSRFAEALETLEPCLKATSDDARALNNPCTRRSAGSHKSWPDPGRSRPRCRSSATARARLARLARRFSPARPLWRLSCSFGRPGKGA
jgi:tetratricopeptide (TPR) repeat protein